MNKTETKSTFVTALLSEANIAYETAKAVLVRITKDGDLYNYTVWVPKKLMRGMKFNAPRHFTFTANHDNRATRGAEDCFPPKTITAEELFFAL